MTPAPQVTPSTNHPSHAPSPASFSFFRSRARHAVPERVAQGFARSCPQHDAVSFGSTGVHQQAVSRNDAVPPVTRGTNRPSHAPSPASFSLSAVGARHAVPARAARGFAPSWRCARRSTTQLPFSGVGFSLRPKLLRATTSNPCPDRDCVLSNFLLSPPKTSQIAPDSASHLASKLHFHNAGLS